MTRTFRALVGAFTYFSILPVGGFANAPGPDALAISFLPLVGGLIGVVGGFVAEVCARVGSPFDVAVAALVTLWVASGAIHVDGFLDCCDALFAQVDAKRRLEILKDPQHGTFALVGIVLLALVWLVVLRQPVAGWSWPLLLGLSGAISRIAAIPNAWVFHYARADHVTRAFMHPPSGIIVGGLAVALEGVVGWKCGFPALAIMPIAGLASLGLGAFAARRFGGGLTGDAYGFIIALLEPPIFLALAVMYHA